MALWPLRFDYEVNLCIRPHCIIPCHTCACRSTSNSLLNSGGNLIHPRVWSAKDMIMVNKTKFNGLNIFVLMFWVPSALKFQWNISLINPSCVRQFTTFLTFWLHQCQAAPCDPQLLVKSPFHSPVFDSTILYYGSDVFFVFFLSFFDFVLDHLTLILILSIHLKAPVCEN